MRVLVTEYTNGRYLFKINMIAAYCDISVH